MLIRRQVINLALALNVLAVSLELKMLDTHTLHTGKFRPNSKDDFSRYAKALAWLIEVPLQRAHELLAKIYGYDDYHELKQVLVTPGVAGPFDDEWLHRDDSGVLAFSKFNPADRSNRTLDLVAKCKGLSNFYGMTSRWMESRDIGLFERPEVHRHLFRRMRIKIEVLETTDVATSLTVRSAQEYAHLGTTITDDNEYVLHFTDIGWGVYNAVSETIERHTWQPPERSYDIETVIEKLDGITQHHPNNPWSRAAKVCFLADMAEYENSFSIELLKEAKCSVTLFELLFEGYEKKAAPHNLVTHNAETFYWPALLYWGGILALECDELQLAKRWLKLNKRLCPQDNFGARFVLSDL